MQAASLTKRVVPVSCDRAIVRGRVYPSEHWLWAHESVLVGPLGSGVLVYAKRGSRILAKLCSLSRFALKLEIMTESETNEQDVAIEALDEIDTGLAAREAHGPNLDPRWSAIGARIIRIAKYLDEDRAGRFAAIGITPIEFDALLTLRLEGGAEQSLFPSQIAEYLRLRRNRVTEIVDGLVTRGLVERFENRANRRHIVVRLSTQGGETVDAAFATYQEGLRELLSSLDEAQHESVIAGLRLVLLGVQDHAKPDPGRPAAAAY